MHDRIRQAALASGVGFCLMLLASCASTTLVSSQRNAAYSGPPLVRLVVIGATSDPRVQRAFEDEFVAKLNAAGITAVPSYPLIRESATADRAQLRKAVEGAGMDGVLAARLVRVEADETSLQEFNFEDRSVGFYSYYSPDSSGAFDPSLGGESSNITIHFDLYSVSGSQLVWAGDAATFPSTDVKQVAAGLAYAVIPALKKQKLI
jgi:ABC-type amino acid transport substrate-binding protein